EVLNVMERYGKHIDSTPNPTGKTTWIGKAHFLPHVYNFVRQRKPVLMTLPAFPCKSANRQNKVLGHLPDLGEELGLRRLHEMASDIGKVYAPGAFINIATDGVLFSDIIGITEEDCWEYGEALKVLIKENDFNTLRFVRPMTMLGLSSFEENIRENYIATAELCREEIMRCFGPSEKTIDTAIRKDKDTGLTYCGMVKFLESELETHLSLTGLNKAAKRKAIKAAARKMMQRSEAFTLAIRTARPGDVRLSIHPSSGAAKLSFPLVPSPEGFFQRSPWHSCVAIGLDGEARCVHSIDVKKTHDLVYKNRRAWYYQEK
ncbi:uncharacterized protein K460DRAFT_245726, partial [Cucurbitaria berberidis CBS 394.84]